MYILYCIWVIVYYTIDTIGTYEKERILFAKLEILPELATVNYSTARQEKHHQQRQNDVAKNITLRGENLVKYCTFLQNRISN